MRTVLAPIKRHPLIAFFVLAYALTWWVYPLLQVSPYLGFPGLLGPALAAIIVAAVAEGRAGIKDLLGRVVRWRVGARWYAVALGLPAVLALATAGLHLLLGAPTPVWFGRVSVLDLIIFVLIIGEELGWRGYALPRLLVSRSALSASLILGVLWGAWHLPTFFVAGTPQYGLPFSAFVLLTVAYSVVFTWVCLPPNPGQRADRHPATRRHQLLPGLLPRRDKPRARVLAAGRRVRRGRPRPGGHIRTEPLTEAPGSNGGPRRLRSAREVDVQ